MIYLLSRMWPAAVIFSASLQLKQAEIHASTEVAAELAAPNSPMEVQHFGYALLQHLVRSPWKAPRQLTACAHLSCNA